MLSVGVEYRCPTMLTLGEAYIVVLVTSLVSGASSQCININGDTSCDANAADGECWFQPLLHCSCSKSCQSKPHCPGPSLDTDCACLFAVTSCQDLSTRDMCPTTCQRRNDVVCAALLPVEHASPSVTNPLYGDKVTYSCDTGYQFVSGSTGLRVCTDDGSWVVSVSDGAPPVCQPIDCGATPVIEDFVASIPSGVYTDEVVYACPAGSVKAGGGVARYTCNTDGIWQEDTSDTHPICVYASNYYTASLHEIDDNAVPSFEVTKARSRLDCARICSYSAICSGFTYTQATADCSFNVGAREPIVTTMKRLYL